MERLILAPVIVLVVGGDLVYIGIVSPEGFYIGAFRQGLVVEI